MKRDRSQQRGTGNTLSEALSPQERGQLLGLRETLETTADEAFSRRLAESRPPWRRGHKPASPDKAPRAKQTQSTDRRVPVNDLPEQNVQHRGEATNSSMRTRSAKPTTTPAEPKFEYWDFPNEVPTGEPPPPPISDRERLDLDAILRAGSGGQTVDGEDLFLVLGVDFGTSSTKMIVRLPYEAGTPTIAIPAPEPCRVGTEPYLWRTMLWLQNDGTFCPWPTADAAVLNALKQGLIQGRSETEISGIATAIPVTRAQAGAALLAYVIQYARGWLIRNRPNLFRGRRPVWFLNLGIPAASYDDQKIADPYRRIGAAALELSAIDSRINAQAAQVFLKHERVVEAGTSEQAAERLGVAVFPEAAAEMTGFAKSTRGAPGLYLLVDVGAMTLDTCMFQLKPEASGTDLYAFMAAQVRPLGVDSFRWFLAEGRTEAQFVRQCDTAIRNVVWSTHRRRDRLATNWQRGHDVPVFLTGGGSAHRLHQEIVTSLGTWMRHFVRNDGIRLLELPVPRALDRPETLSDFGRMAVAWGLSYPPTEIGRIRAMRDVDDVPPPMPVDLSERYVSKDQV